MNENKKINNDYAKGEYVNVNLLHSGLYYQNEPNKERVKQIASKFRFHKYQVIDVSFRDGKYNVIDGQHRLYAAKQAGVKSLYCWVRYGLSESEEMELFVDLAEDRRKVKPMETYKALYGAGNKFVVELINSTRNSGINFDFNDYKKENKIVCIKTMAKLFDKNKSDYSNTLNLIKKTWNGDPITLEAKFLCGIYDFYRIYGDEETFNEKHFIKRLSSISPKDIKIKAKNMDLGEKGFVKICVDTYSYNNSKNVLDDKRIFLNVI